MKRLVLGALLLASSAATADDKTPTNPAANWPTGKLKIDNLGGDDSSISVKFTDSDNKKHDVEVSFDFSSGHINKCSFDDQVLNTIPQYRALASWAIQNVPGIANSRAVNSLACTHPSVDKADETNPMCKGWKDNPGDRADDIAKNGPPFDPARAAKVGVVLYVQYAGDSPGGGKWGFQYVTIKQTIKNDPKATFDSPLTIAYLAGQDKLFVGNGTIYLEQVKDEHGTPIWQLLGGNAKDGSSDWSGGRGGRR
jgi:hypothetical protein